MKEFFDSRRRFARGKNPCGECGRGQHKSCRPRLDGTLCTCSCEKARLVRSDVERKVGVPMEEAVRIWYPRWQREFWKEPGRFVPGSTQIKVLTRTLVPRFQSVYIASAMGLRCGCRQTTYAAANKNEGAIYWRLRCISHGLCNGWKAHPARSSCCITIASRRETLSGGYERVRDGALPPEPWTGQWPVHRWTWGICPSLPVGIARIAKKMHGMGASLYRWSTPYHALQ